MKFSVTGMGCAACQTRVENAVKQVNGVTSVDVSLLTNSMEVEGDFSNADIIQAVKDAGYKADYLEAMRVSPLDASKIFNLINESLTEDFKNRELIIKGIDYSYYYEEVDSLVSK